MNSYSYTNYYNAFYHYKSDNDNNDKDLIEILKEINRREDTAVLVKEARKMMRIVISEKKQLREKLNIIKEQAKEDRAAMNSKPDFKQLYYEHMKETKISYDYVYK